MNVYDHAHALAKAIKTSEEYRAFKQAQENLEKDGAAKEMLADFRKKQWELNSKKLRGEKISSEEEEALSKAWEIIQFNKTVKEYLEKEYRFSVLLSDVQKIITEPLEDFISPEKDGPRPE